VEYPEDCSIEEQVPTYTHKHNKTKDSIFFDDRTSSIGAGVNKKFFRNFQIVIKL